LIKSLASHIPSGQVVRYLLVGAWNTLFGYGCFFLFAHLFLHLMPSQPSLAASVASVVATLTNITVSFIGYKLFVFKTKGNFLSEYARSFLVYLPTLVISAVAIAPLTAILRRTLPTHAMQAPYIAGALLAFFTVVISFFGHKHISFRDRPEAPSA
jgi:putative flippase GtrA